MKTISFKENSSLTADEALLADLNKVGLENLPGLLVSGSKITLPKFTVGEIRLTEHKIQIEPLNKSLTLEGIFEMFAYTENTDNTNLLNESHSFGSSKAGFDSFVNDFLLCTEEMARFGISSTYLQKNLWQSKVRGIIDGSKFSKHLLPIKGVNSKVNYYSKDSTSNQVIKKALTLIKDLKGAKFDNKLLQPFSDVITIKGQLTRKAELNAISEYSPNPYHGIALAYAIMILKDLNIGYSDNGSLKWHSFLVNSNQIYENYLRKLLSSGLEQSVQKPSRPITFAVNKSNSADVKIVEPDILINYSKTNSTAQMVIDAKNKNIVVKKPLSKVSTGDLYQISYYADIFKTKSAALVYPVDRNMDSVRINLHSPSSAKFYILGINMSEPLKKRHTEFLRIVSDIIKISS